MKKQMSYKAKRSMIILAVIVVLAIIASIGTYAFKKFSISVLYTGISYIE